MALLEHNTTGYMVSIHGMGNITVFCKGKVLFEVSQINDDAYYMYAAFDLHGKQWQFVYEYNGSGDPVDVYHHILCDAYGMIRRGESERKQGPEDYGWWNLRVAEITDDEEVLA